MLSYEGRRFRTTAADTMDGNEAGPGGTYHQDGSVVWAEFGGGKVVRGSIVGTCDPDGVLNMTYCQLLGDGRLMAGRVRSIPTVLDDGRVRLEEHWERLGDNTESGVSVMEEYRG